MYLYLLVLISCSILTSFTSAAPNLNVTATTGTYTGLIHPNYTHVRQFLNVPYALPPTNDLRWLPPVKVSTSNKVFDATRFAPSCPQYGSRIPSLWSTYIPQYFITKPGQNSTAGLSATGTSEDCLSLAIWTPLEATNTSSLPVLMFITGGGFQTGGIEVDVQLPGRWVNRTQGHIVVTINYRLNIFGYPNSAGLNSQNIGLLDQRAALEWIRDNIKAFGGDPNAITVWGQSAGSESTDMLTFTYYNDSIARAFHMMSGSALQVGQNNDPKHTNFTFVASKLGCNFPNNATAELACMRKVPFDTIENFIGQYSDNSSSTSPTQPPIAFRPIPDEKVVFSNYSARYEAGLVAKGPAIYSNCANEGSALIPWPISNLSVGPYQPNADRTTLSFLCASHNSSVYRHKANLTTYRYQFAGNFSNFSPLPWLGAFHGTDMPMLFGTYNDNLGNATDFEIQVSQTMEDMIFEFLKDPINGLNKTGWPVFDPTAQDMGTFLRFAADGKAVQNVSGVQVEGACYGMGTYDHDP